MEYSKSIAAAIKSYLDADNWHYSFEEDTGVFKFNLNISGKLKKIMYIISTKSDGFSIRCGISLGAKDCLAEVGEYFHRINYNTVHGSFLLDPRDGEVSFKFTHYCGSGSPANEVVKYGIALCSFMYNKYGDPLAAIMFGMMTPEEAIKAADKSNK